MTPERAQLTVSAAQATKLRCLDNKKKHSAGAIYDALSGVTLRPTKDAQTITVPRGKNYSGLLRLGAMGLFTVASGKLESTAETLTGVSINAQDELVLTFSGPVVLGTETAPADLVTIMDGETPVVVSAVAIPADTVYASVITLDLITDTLARPVTLSVTMGSALANFVDQNGVATPLVATPFEVALT